jgi:hypothetical protein
MELSDQTGHLPIVHLEVMRISKVLLSSDDIGLKITSFPEADGLRIPMYKSSWRYTDRSDVTSQSRNSSEDRYSEGNSNPTFVQGQIMGS